jgi:DNA-binding CsgD family transcriptional regulator/tetratricopeptide (TPR) repeat protein
MAVEVTTPDFVGRSAELGQLEGLLDAARTSGAGRLVMVGGDAGIGKTRLVEELGKRARSGGWLVVVGGCVDLGDVGLAYGPLVEVVRRLRGELGAATVERLLDPPEAAPDAGALGPLLTGTGRTDVVAIPGQMLEFVIGFLQRLGSPRPALLVLEDLHWADQSTRELVAYLARNLPGVPVVVIGTFRSDELHRRHPFRAVLAELHRNPLVGRLDLQGLDRDDLATLVSGLAGAAAPDEFVEQLAVRSEGNPFYVEELVAVGTGGPLPDTLRATVLTRIERLSEATQALLRMAAVLGRDIDEAQLAVVTGLDPLELAGGLREALERQVLVGDPAGCRFRHALIQEAVYGELLPGERQRLHTAAAHALEDDPDLATGPEHVRLALLAHHWEAAGNARRCLVASVRAAKAAEEVGAFAESAAQGERALAYWDQVPDAPRVTGVDRVDHMLRTASALQFGGRAGRAASMARDALEGLGTTSEPEQRAGVLERIGRYHWVEGDQARSIAAYEEAVALVGDRPPSHARAKALAALGQSLMVRSQFARARSVLEAAIEVARSIDDRAVEGHALCSLATSVGYLGYVDEAREMFDHALTITRAVGDIEEVGRVHVNLSSVLEDAGQCEEAVSVARAGIEHAGRTGLMRTCGRVMAANGADALENLGRWDEALALLSGVEDEPTDAVGAAAIEAARGRIALARGNLEVAGADLSKALRRTARSNDIQWRGLTIVAVAELAAERGDTDTEQLRRWASELIELATPADDPVDGLAVLASAMRLTADDAALVAAGRPSGRDDLARIRETADRIVTTARALADQPARLGGRPLPAAGAWLAVIEAEAARAHGRTDPDLWDRAAARWEDIGYPYPTAQARFQEAEAILFTRGPRDRAHAALTTAGTIADRLGAAPLARRVRTLARQARLTLASPRPDAHPAGYEHSDEDARHDDVRRPADLGLTAREAEVLALVAEGCTNRQIGERLFISEKTASVHISNLLRKLAVPSRTAAAAVARRFGVGADA